MIFWNCYSNKIVMAMRVGKETYYMAACGCKDTELHSEKEDSIYLN